MGFGWTKPGFTTMDPVTYSELNVVTVLMCLSTICFIAIWALCRRRCKAEWIAARAESNVSTTSTWEDPCKYRVIDGGSFPQVTSKGERLVLECTDVLYEHSVRDKNLNHCDGLPWTNECRYYSNTQLRTSVYPLVCGWYVMFMQSLVPLIRNSLCQQTLMNRGSLSDTKLRGNPCNFHTIYRKRTATLCTVEWEASKWVLFWITIHDHQDWGEFVWWRQSYNEVERQVFPYGRRDW